MTAAIGRRGIRALASSAAAALCASASGALELSEAVSLALRDSIEARIAELEGGRALDQSAEARGVYLPRLEVTSSAGWSNRIDDTLEAVDGDGEVKRYGLVNLGSTDPWVSVYVSQVVLDLKRWRQVETKELAAEAARIRSRQQRDEIAFEVTRRFAWLHRVQELAALSEELEGAAGRLLDEAESLHEAGRALLTDRDVAALHLEEMTLEADQRRGERIEAQERLWRIVTGEGAARPPRDLDAASVPEPDLTEFEQELEDWMLARTPAMQALKLQERIEHKRVEAARAGRYPTLNFYGGYNHYGAKRFDNFDDEVQVGIDFRIPLFDGFQTTNAVGGAVKAAEIARLRRRAVLADKRERVRSLVRQLRNTAGRLSLLGRRASTTLSQQELADLNLRAGRGSLGQALEARERRARIRRQEIETRFERIELWAALERELGRLALTLTRGELEPPVEVEVE